MSGICGIVEFADLQASETALAKMSQALCSRGPDGETIFHDGHIGFAHRLLHLAEPNDDLVSEAQGLYCATVDGSLHNLSQPAGHWGDSGQISPSKTAMLGYRRSGIAFVRELEGAFALAVYDKSKRRIVLARDRFGIKPLYFHFDRSRLVFASEIRAILGSGYVTAQLDTRAAADYLTFQLPLANRTFFHGIQSVPPATALVFEDRKVTEKRYWQILFQPQDGSVDTYAQQARMVLNEAMATLDLPVPKGSHLSGGLDSSIIALLLAQNNTSLRTYSGVYPYGDQYDESFFAKLVSKSINSSHTFVYPSPEDLQNLAATLIDDLMEPVTDVAFSRYLVAKQIKKIYPATKTVFCGQGADELFGGYAFYGDYLQNKFQGPLFLQSYHRRRLFSRQELRTLLTSDFYEQLFADYDPLSVYQNYFHSGLNQLDAAATADIEVFLPYWLRVEAQIEASHSMDVRYPFLHHAVAALASRLPPQLKVKQKVQKYILREAFAKDLPPEVVAHKKVGFRTPFTQWFRHELHDFAQTLLVSDHAQRSRLFKPAAVQEALHKNRAGELNYGWQIWTLLGYELWHRNFINA